MKIKCYDSERKEYREVKLEVQKAEKTFKVQRSKIPIGHIKRTPELVYLIEFLKCDGTLSIVKRKNSIKGELLFTTVDSGYQKSLKNLLKKQFPTLNVFERNDGIGISSLALSVALAVKYKVPIGKKSGDFKCLKPNDENEAKMVLRAPIDAEGNVDDYSGDTIVANKSTKYLESYVRILDHWFGIKATTNLSPIDSGFSQTFRIGIIRDVDIQKITSIKLLNPTKQKRLEFIWYSFELYEKRKNVLKRKVRELLTKPKSIRNLSQDLKVAPFVIRRILRSIKAKKVGMIEKNGRKQILWSY